jgi:hypothetical protein
MALNTSNSSERVCSATNREEVSHERIREHFQRIDRFAPGHDHDFLQTRRQATREPNDQDLLGTQCAGWSRFRHAEVPMIGADLSGKIVRNN